MSRSRYLISLLPLCSFPLRSSGLRDALGIRSLAAALAAGCLLLGASAAAGAVTPIDQTSVDIQPGALAFGTDPDVADFGQVTLDGTLQTPGAQMNLIGIVDATGSGSGWNVTVQGDSSLGKSPVLAEFCTDNAAANGCDQHGFGAGGGYVPGGQAFAAGSIALESSGGSFVATPGSGTTTTGQVPAHSCDLGNCQFDNAAPVKLVEAAAGKGMGSWDTDAYGGSSVELTVPTTTRVVDTAGVGNKVYQVDLVFSLNSGPGA